MAYTTINKSTDYFDTKLYTGSGSNITVSDLGFQPDWAWFKKRSSGSSQLYDALRGVQIYIHSNSDDGNNTNSDGLTAFNSGGWTVGGSGLASSGDWVAWNWKAGTTGSGTTGGSGSSQSYSYSVNTTSGFSIVKYTGNATGGHTIPHHLGAVPKMILFKQLTGANVDWRVYHEGIGNTHRLALNSGAASVNDDSAFNDTSPTSSVFTVGGSSSTNPSADVIAYCFTDKTGYSKFGSYTGNDSSTFVYTGFKPKFLMIKNASEENGWLMLDAERTTSNPMGAYIYANANSAEGTVSYIDFLSNGFRLVSTSSVAVNKDGNTFVYAAFGQSLVGSNNIPCTAR